MKIDVIGAGGRLRTVSYLSNDNKYFNKKLNYGGTLDNVNFAGRAGSSVPAKLADPLQQKVSKIAEEIDFIRQFYKSKHPIVASKIKKEYPDLIQKKTAVMHFKLPDSTDTLQVLSSLVRENIMYISVDDGSLGYKGIVIDGDKLIANVLKNNPHMLPVYLKYMDAEKMKEAEPEKYINLAFDKIKDYADYIRKFVSGELPIPSVSSYQRKTERKIKVKTDSEKEYKRKELPKQRKEKVSKPKAANVSKVSKYDTIEDLINPFLKKISDFFNSDTKDIPPHIKPKLAPNGKMVAFSLQMDDGGELKVTKKFVTQYRGLMPYLSFEKVNKDKSLNFISIDLISKKVLKTKTMGKPHISSTGLVLELSPEELDRRKVKNKLEYFMSQIFRDTNDEKPVTQATPLIEKTSEKAEEIVTEQIEPKVLNDAEKSGNTVKPEKPVSINENFENLKKDMRILGENDAKIAADEYFDAFKKQFLKDIQQKMSDFNLKISKFFESLSE